jgi:hypothetical protein
VAKLLENLKREEEKRRKRNKRSGKESEPQKQAKEKPRSNLLLHRGTSSSSPGKSKRRAPNVATLPENLKREEEKRRKRIRNETK